MSFDPFDLPTDEALDEFRERADRDGFEFPLAATSIIAGRPLKAQVRRLTTHNKAAIRMLPQTLQDTVWAGVTKFNDLQQRGEEAKSLMDAAGRLEEIRVAADAYCVAAFIRPKLVLTEADLPGNPGARLVSKIESEDRISVFYACLDADSAPAKQLRPFREESSRDVSDDAHVPVAPAPLRSVEPAIQGV